MNRIQKAIHYERYSLHMLRQSSGYLFVLYYVLQILTFTVPMLQIYLFRLVLDGLGMGDKRLVVHSAVMYLLLLALLSLSENAGWCVHDIMMDRLNHRYDTLLLEKLSKLPLAFLDSAKGRNKLNELEQVKGSVLAFSFFLESVLINSYTFAVAFTVLFRYNPFLSVLFLLLVIPGVIWNERSERKIYDWNVKSAPDRRKFSYYRWMLTDAWPAKDVRMYDLTDDIKERYEEEKDSYLTRKRQLGREGMRHAVSASLISEAGFVIFLAIAVWDTIQGKTGIGELSMLTGFAAAVLADFREICARLYHIVTLGSRQFGVFMDFLNEPGETSAGMEGKKKRSMKQFETLEFRDVYFAYPNTERYVLEGINFRLRRGERLAIVGNNGSGKSTLVKLMLGLYPVSKGQILLNDYPLEEYDRKSLLGLYAVLFQEFASYPLTLRENAALSALERQGEDKAILESIQKSGLEYDEKRFPKGLDTSMSRRFSEEGVELSKGQWQKLALARAYFKDADIVIFDEPSSALDAKAEDRIFRNFYKAAQDKTGIMISHRISSARKASKILVLDEGGIKESGTHEELLGLHGIYAELYRLQMEKYLGRRGA